MKLVPVTKRLCLLALLFGSTSVPLALATEVFTWTDENGIVHYSDLPPDNSNSQQIDVPGVYKPGTVETAATSATGGQEAGEPGPSAAQQRRERMRQESAERREAREETEQMCARHRSRLEQIEPARRVFITDEAGESVRLDDDQRMELINESKDYIAKNCE